VVLLADHIYKCLRHNFTLKGLELDVLTDHSDVCILQSTGRYAEGLGNTRPLCVGLGGRVCAAPHVRAVGPAAPLSAPEAAGGFARAGMTASRGSGHFGNGRSNPSLLCRT